ncbi:MAG: T9SS type A sorting domain-containing protein, partial [Bacteroidetes bacterium]|nr:T9SS type A sorting domain-containing protein [Bacteroidota bacterium]
YSWNTGDTTRQITIDSQAVYVLTVTDSNGCQITDSLFARKTVSTSSKLGSLQLFPNPANTHFYVQNLNGEIKNVAIYGLNGHLIHSFPTTINRFGIGQLPTGMYWVQVETTTTTMHSILIKE